MTNFATSNPTAALTCNCGFTSQWQAVYDQHIKVCPSAVSGSGLSTSQSVGVPNFTSDLEATVEDDIFLRPAKVTNLTLRPHLRSAIERVMQMSELTHRPQNMLFVGEAGTAKTTTAHHIAAVYDRPLVKVNCQMLTEASQLYGFREVESGELTYKPSAFSRAIQRAGCIVLLDDIAHVHDRTITNGLLPALDGTRMVEIDYLNMYLEVAEDVIFIGTGNQGYHYTGASRFDAALVSRFKNKFLFDSPEPAQAASILQARTGIHYPQALKIATLAQHISDNKEAEIAIDMRAMIAAAEHMVMGASFFEAVTVTLLGGLSGDKRNALKMVASDNLQDADEFEMEAARNEAKWEVWN